MNWKTRIYVVFTLLLFFAAASCGTKKKSIKVETQRSDTLIQKIEVIKAPLLNDVMTIKEICEDSTAIEIKRIFIRDTDTVTIETVDNSLKIKVSQQEKTISSRQETIRKLEEKISEQSEVIKERYSFKLIVILVGIIVALWMLPGIPATVNGFVRRLFTKVF